MELFRAVERTHGVMLVSRALGLITVSKYQFTVDLHLLSIICHYHKYMITSSGPFQSPLPQQETKHKFIILINT